MSKPRGLNTARKLKTTRRDNRWADAAYKKRALGNFYKSSPTGGSSQASGIVLEKVGVEAKQPNSAIRKCVRIQREYGSASASAMSSAGGRAAHTHLSSAAKRNHSDQERQEGRRLRPARRCAQLRRRERRGAHLGLRSQGKGQGRHPGCPVQGAHCFRHRLALRERSAYTSPPLFPSLLRSSSFSSSSHSRASLLLIFSAPVAKTRW